MLTSVVSAWLATPRPPSAVVPIRPTMAASASRNSGSATRAPNAGTASRRISASCGLRLKVIRRGRDRRAPATASREAAGCMGQV
jgi:hypothetical protein